MLLLLELCKTGAVGRSEWVADGGATKVSLFYLPVVNGNGIIALCYSLYNLRRQRMLPPVISFL